MSKTYVSDRIWSLSPSASRDRGEREREREKEDCSQERLTTKLRNLRSSVLVHWPTSGHCFIFFILFSVLQTSQKWIYVIGMFFPLEIHRKSRLSAAATEEIISIEADA